MSIFSYIKVVSSTKFMHNIVPIVTVYGQVPSINYNYVNTTVFVYTNTQYYYLLIYWYN